MRDDQRCAASGIETDECSCAQFKFESFGGGGDLSTAQHTAPMHLLHSYYD